MIIKKIKLKNIRSYPSLELDFQTGATLLSGDIGSGKTSILLAIEFALFGLQPGQRGASLLRNGENEGVVYLEFEIDGKLIGVERSLKRGKTVSQDYSALVVDGEKKEMAVTELKNKILNLLSYPLEFAKKTNLLYRFTVYTLQEEMKQIIIQDAKTRLDTLRHVFGVDKYKKIIENASFVTAKLREETRLKQGAIGDIEIKKKMLNEKEDELRNLEFKLNEEKVNFELKKRNREDIEVDIGQVKEKIDERNNLVKELEKTKIFWGAKKEQINSVKNEIENLSIQIRELMNLPFSEQDLTKLENEISENKIKKEDFNKNYLEVNSMLNSLTMKNQDKENIKEKMQTIEVCPTCLQNVDENYKEKVFSNFDAEIQINLKKISELESQKIQITTSINEINNLNIDCDNKVSELRILKIRKQGVDEKKLRLSELEANLSSFMKDADILSEQVETLEKTIFEFSRFESLFQQKSELLERAVRDEKNSEIKLAEFNQGLKYLEKNIFEIIGEIQEKEKIRDMLHYLMEVESWLVDKFIPMMAFIESSVMMKLRNEFSKLFDEWFKMLVSDNFTVSLDEEFTPIVEQQGYEIDYAHLSGGERTAIALAYRLALNQVINSIMSRIKTKNLIILDEPTDGFSEQQLDKIRDVLLELNAEQLILVSHEQKIEGFVENIIRIKKENGVAGVV